MKWIDPIAFAIWQCQGLMSWNWLRLLPDYKCQWLLFHLVSSNTSPSESCDLGQSIFHSDRIRLHIGAEDNSSPNQFASPASARMLCVAHLCDLACAFVEFHNLVFLRWLCNSILILYSRARPDIWNLCHWSLILRNLLEIRVSIRLQQSKAFVFLGFSRYLSIV